MQKTGLDGGNGFAVATPEGKSQKEKKKKKMNNNTI